MPAATMYDVREYDVREKVMVTLETLRREKKAEIIRLPVSTAAETCACAAP